MDYHKNARLTVHSREQMARMVVDRRCTLKAAALAFNVSPKTAAKWLFAIADWVRPGSAISVQSHIGRLAKPIPPYWKRFLLFAGCAGMAGASRTKWESVGPPSAGFCAVPGFTGSPPLLRRLP